MPACPLGVATAVVSHAGQSQQWGTTCTEITGVDEQCVNNSLPIGKKMGPWTPANNCNNFVDNIFKKCKPCGPEERAVPDALRPMREANGWHDGLRRYRSLDEGFDCPVDARDRVVGRLSVDGQP